jgi:hypothetical protein
MHVYYLYFRYMNVICIDDVKLTIKFVTAYLFQEYACIVYVSLLMTPSPLPYGFTLEYSPLVR